MLTTIIERLTVGRNLFNAKYLEYLKKNNVLYVRKYIACRQDS